MYTLHTIIVTSLQEYLLFYLNLFSLFSIFFSILVIVNKNPVVSILFLICLFILISGYLMSLGMNFIGLSYLLVYIGAVSILFLFILMLINIRISEIQTETMNSLPLAIIFSISFYLALYGLTPTDHRNNESLFSSEYKFHPFEFVKGFSEEIKYAVSVQWDTNIVELLHISGIGNLLYTNYFLWLILASIILLLAMVGTIIITIRQDSTN